MKYDIETVEDLTEHALGNRKKKAKKAAKPAPPAPKATPIPVVPTPAPKPTPAPVKKAPIKWHAGPPPYVPGDPKHPF